MSEDHFLMPHAGVDTAQLEEDLRRSVAERRAQSSLTESLLDLLYAGRLTFDGPDLGGLRGRVEHLLQRPALSADFRPVSIHPVVGPVIQRIKALALWAVRGLVADVAQQQQTVNEAEAAVLADLVEALADKVDRHAPVDAYGFDRVAFYQRLTYPEPFPADAVARLVPPDASVWELGAGTGEVLAALTHARAIGVEQSPSCVNLLERRGLTVVHGDLLDFLEERRGDAVDVIVLSRVVDHLDPGTLARVLATAGERLAAGGWVLLVSGPRSYIERDITTVRFYPHAALTALLATMGFSSETVILSGSAGATEPTGWYALRARRGEGP
jgi:hypothetical protein